MGAVCSRKNPHFTSLFEAQGGLPPKPQAQRATEEQQRYRIVDLEDSAKSLDVTPGSEAEQYYKKAIENRPSALPRPWLCIAYGPPASGKTRIMKNFVSSVIQAKDTDYVHLDIDELRHFLPDYRHCLCGTHAAKLESVRSELGERIRPREWRSPLGGFMEPGMAVDGEFLALSTAAVRSNQLLRDKMLWGKPQKQPDGTNKWGAVGDNNCFIDRALIAGYNIVYDTVGDAPDGLLKELMRRARSQHPYKIYACGVYAPLEFCQKRAEGRATASGRYVSDSFLQRQYKSIFPGGEGEQLVHFNKFVAQLREGDEAYLYDNSAEERSESGGLKLIKRHPE